MRRLLPAAALVAVAAVAACDVPTEAPIIDQRWILPVEETTIGVADLLPDGVTESGSVFTVSVDPSQTTITLGDVCSQCRTFNGVTAPKPAFSATISVSQGLPANVASVVVASGAIDLTIRNGFNFDPIRPGGGNTGSVAITIRDGPGGPALGALTLDGATTALPAGGTVSRSIPLSGSVSSSLHADVVLTSPSGDPVTIDASDQFTVEATANSVGVSSATVNVSNEVLTVDRVSLDTGGLDSEVVNRIQSGAIILDVANPFNLQASGQIDIDYPGGSIGKSVQIGSGASTVSVAYTGEELRRFLGVDGAGLTGSFTVSSGAGSVTVTPGQEITIDSKIDLTIRIGG